MEQKMIDIVLDTLDEFPEGHPWEGNVKKLTDALIAKGVVVREKGKWGRIYIDGKYDWAPSRNEPWACPKCGEIISWMREKPEWNFCGKCGADMREDKNEN